MPVPEPEHRTGPARASCWRATCRARSQPPSGCRFRTRCWKAQEQVRAGGAGADRPRRRAIPSRPLRRLRTERRRESDGSEMNGSAPRRRRRAVLRREGREDRGRDRGDHGSDQSGSTVQFGKRAGRIRELTSGSCRARTPPREDVGVRGRVARLRTRQLAEGTYPNAMWSFRGRAASKRFGAVAGLVRVGVASHHVPRSSRWSRRRRPWSRVGAGLVCRSDRGTLAMHLFAASASRGSPSIARTRSARHATSCRAAGA